MVKAKWAAREIYHSRRREHQILSQLETAILGPPDMLQVVEMDSSQLLPGTCQIIQDACWRWIPVNRSRREPLLRLLWCRMPVGEQSPNLETCQASMLQECFHQESEGAPDDGCLGLGWCPDSTDSLREGKRGILRKTTQNFGPEDSTSSGGEAWAQNNGASTQSREESEEDKSTEEPEGVVVSEQLAAQIQAAYIRLWPEMQHAFEHTLYVTW